MALFIEGKSICCLCNKIIDQAENAVLFPPFIVNKYDPLMVFSDATVHSLCLENHPMAQKLQELLDAYDNSDRLTCSICHKKIEQPDEYIGTGCLSSCTEELSKYNFTQYHKQCFEGSEPQKNIRNGIESLKQRGEWDSLTQF